MRGFVPQPPVTPAVKRASMNRRAQYFGGTSAKIVAQKSREAAMTSRRASGVGSASKGKPRKIVRWLGPIRLMPASPLLPAKASSAPAAGEIRSLKFVKGNDSE